MWQQCWLGSHHTHSRTTGLTRKYSTKQFAGHPATQTILTNKAARSLRRRDEAGPRTKQTRRPYETGQPGPSCRWRPWNAKSPCHEHLGKISLWYFSRATSARSAIARKGSTCWPSQYWQHLLLQLPPASILLYASACDGNSWVQRWRSSQRSSGSCA